MNSRSQKRIPTGIIVVSAVMILFGFLEIATAFSHSFFGITTSPTTIATYSSAPIGAFYVLAGLVVLTRRRWGAYLAILFLAADILGRLALVATGLYPLNSAENSFGIIVGTTIALLIAVYIYSKRSIFYSDKGRMLPSMQNPEPK